MGIEVSTAAPRTRSRRTLRIGAIAAIAVSAALLGIPSASHADSPGVFTVRLRGHLDRSRRRLIERAIERRDAAARAAGRPIALRVDVDSEGGEAFAGMEIGRLLRGAGASMSVGPGASCVSACVFALMGAVERHVADGARVGIHRPSLGSQRDDALVASMSASIALYADEMRVSRALIDDMMAVPADRIRFLSAADLARYGITASRAGAKR